MLIDDNNINHNFIMQHYDNGFNLDTLLIIMERGGNRVPRMEAAFIVARDNLVIGIGAGNYFKEIQNINFESSIIFSDSAEIYNKPPTNIFLELIINIGLFGGVFLLFIIISFIYKIKHSILAASKKKIYISICFTYLIMSNFDSNYLRAYAWVAFGLISGITYYKKNRIL